MGRRGYDKVIVWCQFLWHNDHNLASTKKPTTERIPTICLEDSGDEM